MSVLRPILGAFCLATTLSVTSVSFAQDALPTPEGNVILTISGPIGKTNAEEGAQFDLAMLKALPAREFTTTTIWTEGEHVFTGVALSDLMAYVDAPEATLKATAVNDYAVDLPASDLTPEGAMLAYMLDGKEMSLRDKGPLWVVYDYDGNADYRSEVIYSRSIWQLDRIVVGN
jgi:hypothetical protein